MRISDRLARLEQKGGADARMSRQEIEAAALEFDNRMVVIAGRRVVDADEARTRWRAVVEAPNPGWLQRVFANAYVEDLSL